METKRLFQVFPVHQVPWNVFILVLALSLSSGGSLLASNPPTILITSKADITVSGTVTSETGETLPGVSVRVKGGSAGTSTDANGRFSLTVDENAILIFSYIGFTTQEVSVAGRSSINVVLVESSTDLQEVVVIGYQTVRRQDVTGATGTVNTRQTERLVSRSLPENLQGMAAGVNVRTGGSPGQEAVVNIRGIGTFGNTSPLYVIDGMFSDPNTTINPNDVESIQILKDASAAAIYGSRAANGVVLITTKKGREGAPQITVSTRNSISEIPRRYDMMNAAEYVATNTRAFNASGEPLQPGIAAYNGAVNTNWADEILRTGAVQDYNATISGGGANSRYLLSGGYFKDKGTLIGRDFDRGSFRINTEATRGKFKFGENIGISTSTLRTPFQGGFAEGNPWYDVWSSIPILPVRSDAFVSTGNPGGWGYGSTEFVNTFSRNQVAIADITSIKNNFAKLLGNAFLQYDILEGLTYKFNAGLETSFDKSQALRKEGSWYQNQSPDLSRLTDTRSQYLSYLFEHTLNFSLTRSRHTLNGVVGYTEQTNQRDNTIGSGSRLSQFGGNYFTTLNTTSGVPGDRTASGTRFRSYLTSFLGRLNYNFADRYLATFTFRTDKDSRFSPENRIGTFPSVALAWRLSNENFFKVDWISDLKIRGSWGMLGVNTLSEYQYFAFLNQGPSAVFGPDQQTFPGATQARLAYEDLKWEEKETTNLGLDATILDNRLTLAIDVFRSISRDVLVGQPLPRYLGNLQGDPIVNFASVRNQGLEFEAGFRPRTSPAGFTWDLGANFSIIRNEVLGFGNLGVDPITGQPRTYITSGNTRTQIGRSIGDFFVLRTNGIFQNQQEIAAHRAQQAYAQPGDIRYRNLVDGGTNDDINDADRAFAGSPWPKFTTGLQFNSSFKNFTLGLQLYGAFGQKIYNDVRRELDSFGNSNYRRDIDPWTPENPNAEDPRLGYQFAAGNANRGLNENARDDSDRWIEDGSFLRLRNLELGYLIPERLVSRAGVRNLRIYVSAQNLFTLTKYTGLDPDIVGANANSNSIDNPPRTTLEPGVDTGNYPASRIISFGLNAGF
ncbi:TonB-dependent receptor [Pedobacter sp. SYSU D00535]|uniref:SusC/RagA family TonB-linked outer membrane protein n=1 Tax=Pedobacter sp. SYSU D00535 TaxID=2810308 RepID=UPI001A97AE48|nr:TonB-dependent receptor [Pedobacter sp. SYSU D00535]